MVALLVIMSAVLLQGSSQRTLPKENEPRQAFFFNGSHPTLGVSVQVWTPGRQHNRLAPIGFDQPPERGAEFRIAILQPILVFGQKSPLLQADRPGLLFYPLLVRMPRHSRYTDPAALHVDEEPHVVGDRALPGQDFRREEVRAAITSRWVRMKSFQPTVFFRWGAGAVP